MGRFLPVCCLTIILAGCERQEQTRPRSSPGVELAAINAGPLTIDPGGFDFGVIDPKSIHQALITLRNNGADPIRIIDAKPEILNHNTETVPRLYHPVRPQGRYEWTLSVLQFAKQNGMITKSGMMLGLGETTDEILEVMSDLRRVKVDILTLGQ